MADVRILRGTRVQTVGSPVGVQVSTFGLQRLMGITGADMEPLSHEALQPAYNQVLADWPVLTGASRDSLRIETDEVGPKHVRASLRIGGAPLIADARNEKHLDYAPYIEFNGSPGGTPPGTILYAMSANDRLMRSILHTGVQALLRARMRA